MHKTGVDICQRCFRSLNYKCNGKGLDYYRDNSKLWMVWLRGACSRCADFTKD